MATINTRTAAHRSLRFGSLESLEAELARIEAASAAGTLRTTGNWTLGQICEHLGKFVRCSYDGFDGRPPLPVRVLGRLVFKRLAMGDGPVPRGIRLPKDAVSSLPDPDITHGAGIALLRTQLARIHSGEQMRQPSPLFGSLTHEQWLHLHLKHAAMHLGFVEYPAHG
ncbi:MAG: DUF1569 domain-containing protein [Phycisphaerales bacterium]|nr:DUF1569 domain-containing protein [Phycisphaerales bacterium]